MNRPAACEVEHLPVEVMDPMVPAAQIAQGLLGDSVVVENSPQESVPEEGVFVFPASLEQIRYWTLDQLDGASTASNMAIAARLDGAVDDRLVDRAIHAIVDRHEALRT